MLFASPREDQHYGRTQQYALRGAQSAGHGATVFGNSNSEIPQEPHHDDSADLLHYKDDDDD